MKPSIEFANQIIARFDASVGDVVTQMKLQKLLYYAHGWSMAINGHGLFDEHVEAWKDGPVVHSVYSEFSRYGRAAIVLDQLPPLIDNPILDAVVESYGEHSAAWLRNQTHREAPWIATFDGSFRQVIPTENIAQFFIAQRDRPTYDIHQAFLDAWLVARYGAVQIDTSHLEVTAEDTAAAARELGLV